jgi:hypothetical protein
MRTFHTGGISRTRYVSYIVMKTEYVPSPNGEWVKAGQDGKYENLTGEKLAKARKDKIQLYIRRETKDPVFIRRKEQLDADNNMIALKDGEDLNDQVEKLGWRPIVEQLTGLGSQEQSAGLNRVEELFEARKPKGKAELSRIDGIVEVIRSDAGTIVEVTHTEKYEVELDLPVDSVLAVLEGDLIEAGQLIGSSASTGDLTAPVKGLLVKSKDGLVIRAEDVVPASKYPIPHNAKLLVKSGDRVRAGDPLTAGPLDPQELLEVRGRAEVQSYIVTGVQRVYRSQGVTISDKHIEIIVRQLLRDRKSTRLNSSH